MTAHLATEGAGRFDHADPEQDTTDFEPFMESAVSRTKIYRVWKSMMNRCLLPSNRQYFRYGGRGISVCQRWRTLQNFIDDMGPTVPEGMSIERINNNKGYSPLNCRWANAREQAQNRRNNLNYTFNGETKCLPEWARQLRISFHTIRQRIKNGWPIEDALTSPHRFRFALPKTCKNGHWYTKENAYLNPGHRVCKICHKEVVKAYKLRQGQKS